MSADASRMLSIREVAELLGARLIASTDPEIAALLGATGGAEQPGSSAEILEYRAGICRGPDAAGSWIRPDVALGLAHLPVMTDLVCGAIGCS